MGLQLYVKGITRVSEWENKFSRDARENVPPETHGVTQNGAESACFDKG